MPGRSRARPLEKRPWSFGVTDDMVIAADRRADEALGGARPRLDTLRAILEAADAARPSLSFAIGNQCVFFMEGEWRVLDTEAGTGDEGYYASGELQHVVREALEAELGGLADTARVSPSSDALRRQHMFEGAALAHSFIRWPRTFSDLEKLLRDKFGSGPDWAAVTKVAIERCCQGAVSAKRVVHSKDAPPAPVISREAILSEIDQVTGGGLTDDVRERLAGLVQEPQAVRDELMRLTHEVLAHKDEVWALGEQLQRAEARAKSAEGALGDFQRLTGCGDASAAEALMKLYRERAEEAEREAEDLRRRSQSAEQVRAGIMQSCAERCDCAGSLTAPGHVERLCNAFDLLQAELTKHRTFTPFAPEGEFDSPLTEAPSAQPEVQPGPLEALRSLLIRVFEAMRAEERSRIGPSPCISTALETVLIGALKELKGEAHG